MSLIALAGLPGVGKTTRLIRTLQEAKEKGRPTRLFLCSDSEELRSRPHVREGGLMGCRTPGLNFPIDHFVPTQAVGQILEELPEGVLVAFDEATWFGPEIVSVWAKAERRGMDLIVSSLSDEQIQRLSRIGYDVTTMTVPCMLCGREQGTRSVECFVSHGRSFVVACDACNEAIEHNRRRARRVRLPEKVSAEIVDFLKRMKPFPNEEHAYQPLVDIKLPGWDFVRGDSPVRAQLIWATFNDAFPSISEATINASSLPSGARSELSHERTPHYLDLGCCTGYFCEFFAARGWRSTGLDIDKDFIQLARHLTHLRESRISYFQQGLLDFVRTHTHDFYDITSSFATVQWVMAQSGLDDGMECLKWIFSKAKRMCALEMGYTEEEIYKDKLPIIVDREWVLDTMHSFGGFDQVIHFEKGTRGLWRDLFIGLKQPEVPVSVNTTPSEHIKEEDVHEPVEDVEPSMVRKATLLATRVVHNPGRAIDLAGKAIRDPVRAVQELRKRLR